jgi:hypothetical protein
LLDRCLLAQFPPLSTHKRQSVFLSAEVLFSTEAIICKIRVGIAFVRGNSMGQVEQWQILAEEAAQEKDPKKLAEIIEALTRALDDRDAKRNGSSSHKQGAA